jgi:thymidylate kinase
VVALSGLDGAGKSTQAERLCATLRVLGFEADVVWSSLADHPRWLNRIAGVARRVVAWRSGPTAGAQGDAELKARGQEARRASPLLTAGWAGLVTARLLGRVARELAPSTARGRIVVCDRYLLDARVHLRYQYGDSGPVRACARLLGLGFPTPRAAFLLDLDPATASARKPEYDAAANERRRALYLEEAEALGVAILDAARPADELAAEIAKTAWLRL